MFLRLPARLRDALIAGPVALTLGAATLVACGTDAVGAETCRQIETARCKQAAACGIPLDQPLHRGSDVDSCIRYYEGACLHGLVASADPGAVALKTCVDAINSGDCTTVLHPELNDAGACSFLIPPPASTVDAAADAVAPTDAPPDAPADASGE